MPLDQFSLTSAEVTRREYAELLLEEPCMEAAGYSYDVPWRDLSATDRPSFNGVHRRLYTVELAHQWGYHIADTPETTFDDFLKFGESVSALSEAGANTLRGCNETARATIPLIHVEANWVAGLANQAYLDALNDDEVLEAAKLWKECMKPIGVADLPTSPADMPSPSLSADVNELHASAREKTVAVADVKCRESSGYAEALYQAEWRLQLVLMEQNADELTRVGSLLRDNAAIVDEVIASHPVSH